MKKKNKIVLDQKIIEFLHEQRIAHMPWKELTKLANETFPKSNGGRYHPGELCSALNRKYPEMRTYQKRTPKRKSTSTDPGLRPASPLTSTPKRKSTSTDREKLVIVRRIMESGLSNRVTLITQILTEG